MPERSQLCVWKVFSHMQVSFVAYVEAPLQREVKYVFHENRDNTEYMHNLYLLEDTASACKSNSCIQKREE